MHENPLKHEKVWSSVKAISAKASLKANQQDKRKFSNIQIDFDDYSGVYNEDALTYESYGKRNLKNSVFVSEEGNVVAGGTDVALNALAGYLRYLEGTARDDWQE